MSQSFKIQWVHNKTSTLYNGRCGGRRLILGNVGRKVHIMKETNVVHSIVTMKAILRLRLYENSKPANGGTLAFFCEEVEWLYGLLTQRKPGWMQRTGLYRQITLEFVDGGSRITLTTTTSVGQIWLPLLALANLIMQIENEYLPALKAMCEDAKLPAILTDEDVRFSGL